METTVYRKNKEDYFQSDEFLEYLHDLIIKAALRKRSEIKKNETKSA